MDYPFRPIECRLIPFFTAFTWNVIVLSLSSDNLHLLFCLFLFFLSYSPYGVVLCCYRKRFSYSFKVSFSLPCQIFLVVDFACLSLEMSLHCFFLPIFVFWLFLLCWLCIIYVIWGIKAITNSNGDSASLWKVPPKIFTLVKLYPPAVYSTILFSMIFPINFMT